MGLTKIPFFFTPISKPLLYDQPDIMQQKKEQRPFSLVYPSPEGATIEIFYKDENLWFNLKNAAILLGTREISISRQIDRILKTNAQTASEQLFIPAPDESLYYRLDLLIAIGYYINADKTFHLMNWVKPRLKYVLKTDHGVSERKEQQNIVPFISDSDPGKSILQITEQLGIEEHERNILKEKPVTKTEFPDFERILKSMLDLPPVKMNKR